MNRGGKPMIRCVGAVVHDDSGRLLLIRRTRPPGAGLWSLPGGKVESGESDAAAVRREVREETGLEIAVGAFVGRVERPAPSGVFDIHDYAAVVTGGDLRAGDDAAEAGWFDLATFTTMRTSGELVDELAETLDGWGVLPR
ncbi:NUDIX hydrolase [Actinokineospora fastidiosa]|uniref:NUDIX hydrolase n=1 Tax=Actinokineospora fastidiosa TaxID=1816 RepID=UPI001E422E91|nr:NUDIX domain-containing protein [Actinokineospora fastidiosa]